MSKKRMSLEEKRQAILDIYNERQEVFNLKEIESLGARAGVIQNTIKSVNQSLLDDNLIESDKIGAAVFFWSFPAKLSQALRVEKSSLETEAQRLEERSTRGKRALEEATVGREETEERSQKIQRLEYLQVENERLRGRIEELKENDPEEMERLEREVTVCRDSANRWTDNVWEIKGWCVKKRGMEAKMVDKMLGISASFDYVI